MTTYDFARVADNEITLRSCVKLFGVHLDHKQFFDDQVVELYRKAE